MNILTNAMAKTSTSFISISAAGSVGNRKSNSMARLKKQNNWTTPKDKRQLIKGDTSANPYTTT